MADEDRVLQAELVADLDDVVRVARERGILLADRRPSGRSRPRRHGRTGRSGNLSSNAGATYRHMFWSQPKPCANIIAVAPSPPVWTLLRTRLTQSPQAAPATPVGDSTRGRWAPAKGRFRSGEWVRQSPLGLILRAWRSAAKAGVSKDGGTLRACAMLRDAMLRPAPQHEDRVSGTRRLRCGLTNMTHSRCCPLIAIALCLLALPAQAQQWTTYRNASGTTVPVPAGLFTVRAGEGIPPGQEFTSADGRARLHVFAFANERNESPRQFIKRVIVDDRRKLTYERIARDFFVFSAPEGDRVLYRRCNFSRDRVIHCVDLRYPRTEKRAFDGLVTRMSLGLRPR